MAPSRFRAVAPARVSAALLLHLALGAELKKRLASNDLSTYVKSLIQAMMIRKLPYASSQLHRVFREAQRRKLLTRDVWHLVNEPRQQRFPIVSRPGLEVP